MYNATRAINTMNKYNLCASDVKDCVIRQGEKLISAVRITLDRLLSSDELARISRDKHVISHNEDGRPLVTFYRYAPEIQYSYLYVIC